MTTCLIAFIVAMLFLGLSWIATCGLIFLMFLCFGWEFSWLLATAVWLGMMLVGWVFRLNVTVFNSRD